MLLSATPLPGSKRANAKNRTSTAAKQPIASTSAAPKKVPALASDDDLYICLADGKRMLLVRPGPEGKMTVEGTRAVQESEPDQLRKELAKQESTDSVEF